MTDEPAKDTGQARAPARIEEVDAGHAGRRLDNFLGTQLEGAPRTYLYRIVRSGEVRVNGRRATPAQRLEAGDKVRIPPFAAAPTTAPRIGRQVLARLEARILYEDERLLVIDKPAGIAVHGGSGLDYGIIDIVRTLRPDGGRIDLVHRLDRDTSGCLLLARDTLTLRALNAGLRDGAMHKAYVALLAGELPRRPIDCAAPLALVPDRHGEKHAVVSPEGMAARTGFRVRSRHPGATLAAVTLDTGRTHQIRAHAAYLGYPVAGDERYGDSAFNRRLRELGLRRLFLHAEQLSFTLERPMSFSAPLPDDLAAVLERLGPAAPSAAD